MDQFGTLQLDVTRPNLLMVPTSKDGVQQLDPLDHFQCYKVRVSRGTPKFAKRTVSLVNQFETVSVKVIKPVRLCAPASKNNEDPTAPDHAQHLVCYKTQGTRASGGTHLITNQFGTNVAAQVIARRELCLPAQKNPPPSTTTTTTPTTTSSTTTTTTPTTTSSTTSSTTPTTTSSTTLVHHVVDHLFDQRLHDVFHHVLDHPRRSTGRPAGPSWYRASAFWTEKPKRPPGVGEPRAVTRQSMKQRHPA